MLGMQTPKQGAREGDRKDKTERLKTGGKMEELGMKAWEEEVKVGERKMKPWLLSLSSWCVSQRDWEKDTEQFTEAQVNCDRMSCH